MIDAFHSSAAAESKSNGASGLVADERSDSGSDSGSETRGTVSLTGREATTYCRSVRWFVEGMKSATLIGGIQGWRVDEAVDASLSVSVSNWIVGFVTKGQLERWNTQPFKFSLCICVMFSTHLKQFLNKATGGEMTLFFIRGISRMYKVSGEKLPILNWNLYQQESLSETSSDRFYSVGFATFSPSPV